MTDGTPALSILICDRRVPATAGTRSNAALTLEAMGHRVAVGADGPIDDLGSYDVLLLWGTPGYFPRLRRQLR